MKDSNIRRIISDLESLNLKRIPLEEVVELFSRIGKISLMITDFAEGAYSERAVNNTLLEPVFSDVDRISFKPASKSKKYARGNLPNQTMFY